MGFLNPQELSPNRSPHPFRRRLHATSEVLDGEDLAVLSLLSEGPNPWGTGWAAFVFGVVFLVLLKVLGVFAWVFLRISCGFVCFSGDFLSQKGPY